MDDPVAAFLLLSSGYSRLDAEMADHRNTVSHLARRVDKAIAEANAKVSVLPAVKAFCETMDADISPII